MVEHEYAQALFELAIEEKKTELFLDYLTKIIDVMSNNNDFYKMISSPLVELIEKKKIILNVFDSFDETFKNFLCVLVTNNRFNLIEKINIEYDNLLSDYNSILNVEVISSEKLSKANFNEVKKTLENKYPDKKLKIENTVNPKILYGLQIICNGQSLDISLKNRLMMLKDSL